MLDKRTIIPLATALIFTSCGKKQDTPDDSATDRLKPPPVYVKDNSFPSNARQTTLTKDVRENQTSVQYGDNIRESLENLDLTVTKVQSLLKNTNADASDRDYAEHLKNAKKDVEMAAQHLMEEVVQSSPELQDLDPGDQRTWPQIFASQNSTSQNSTSQNSGRQFFTNETREQIAFAHAVTMAESFAEGITRIQIAGVVVELGLPEISSLTSAAYGLSDPRATEGEKGQLLVSVLDQEVLGPVLMQENHGVSLSRRVEELSEETRRNAWAAREFGVPAEMPAQ